MLKFLNSIGNALALYLPMFFCAYIPTVYAINFLLVSRQNSLALPMALGMLVSSFILFAIFAYLWQLLLKAIYKKLADNLTFKGFRDFAKTWLIITVALCLAILFDNRLWDSPEIFLTRNEKYVTETLKETVGKVSAIWVFVYGLIHWTFNKSK